MDVVIEDAVPSGIRDALPLGDSDSSDSQGDVLVPGDLRSDVKAEPVSWAPQSVVIGADACCLNAEAGLVVWIEGGALRRLDTASGLITELVPASEPGTPCDPAIVPGVEPIELSPPVADLRAIELRQGTLMWLAGAALEVVPEVFSPLR